VKLQKTQLPKLDSRKKGLLFLNAPLIFWLSAEQNQTDFRSGRDCLRGGKINSLECGGLAPLLAQTKTQPVIELGD
jgi:hypothetical protein